MWKMYTWYLFCIMSALFCISWWNMDMTRLNWIIIESWKRCFHKYRYNYLKKRVFSIWLLRRNLPCLHSFSLSFTRDKYIDTYIERHTERHIERVIIWTSPILFYNKVQGYESNCEYVIVHSIIYLDVVSNWFSLLLLY